MEPQAVKDLIASGFQQAEITVTGDGSHFDALIISDEFEGKNTLARQRMVFAACGDAIGSGQLHNLNITAKTRAQAGLA